MVSAPLVEAILEIRWELRNRYKRPPIDANYKIFLGRFFDRVTKEYAHQTPLPPSNMPDEISAYIPQYQFRMKKDVWPLIQVGQGIVTLNDTEKYSWVDSKKRSCDLIDMLYTSYPDSNKLKINNIILRYINGVPFNFTDGNLIEFLKKLNCGISMDNTFFDITCADKKIDAFEIAFGHILTQPKGRLLTRFGKGTLRNKDAIMWEMGVQSLNGDVPKNKDELISWVESAHEIPHKWYNSIKDKVEE